jgi:hypothetical protein
MQKDDGLAKYLAHLQMTQPAAPVLSLGQHLGGYREDGFAQR